MSVYVCVCLHVYAHMCLCVCVCVCRWIWEEKCQRNWPVWVWWGNSLHSLHSVFTALAGLPDSGRSRRRACQEAASEGQRSRRWKHQWKYQGQVSGGEPEFYCLHQAGASAGLCAHHIGTQGETHKQSRPTSSPPRVGSSPPTPHTYPHSLTVTQSHTGRAASRPQVGGWQCQWPPTAPPTAPPGTCRDSPSTFIRSESERVAPTHKCCHRLDHSRSSSNPPHGTSTGETLPLTQPLRMWPRFLLINLSLFSFEQK